MAQDVEYTMMRSIVVTVASFAVLFALPGCSSFETALKSALDAVFNVPAAEDIDYSYPATGAAAQEGAIVFKSKPALLEKLFYNPALPVPADESEIVVYFGFETEGFRWDWDLDMDAALLKLLLEWIPPERSGGRGAILWGDVDKHYGKCDILFGNASREGELRIRRHPAKPTDSTIRKNSGFNPLIVLDSATTENVSVEMNDYISGGKTSHLIRHIPPYPWGELVLSGRAYRIFSVVEKAYYAMYPDFSQEERKGYAGSNRVETTAGNFLRKEQRFQILDNSDAVVAELSENNYTLYDTLPQTEWDDMKQALALFYAFRILARGLW
jgi:hypothetical protein